MEFQFWAVVTGLTIRFVIMAIEGGQTPLWHGAAMVWMFAMTLLVPVVFRSRDS